MIIFENGLLIPKELGCYRFVVRPGKHNPVLHGPSRVIYIGGMKAGDESSLRKRLGEFICAAMGFPIKHSGGIVSLKNELSINWPFTTFSCSTFNQTIRYALRLMPSTNLKMNFTVSRYWMNKDLRHAVLSISRCGGNERITSKTMTLPLLIETYGGRSTHFAARMDHS